MPSAPNSALGQLVKLLLETSKLLHRQHINQRKPQAVPLTHTKTLAFIKTQGQPTMKAIADYLGITPPSTTALVNQFVDHGYLKRLEDKTDRRIVRLELTRQGEAYLAKCHESFASSITEVLSCLEPDQLEALAAILTTINKRYHD